MYACTEDVRKAQQECGKIGRQGDARALSKTLYLVLMLGIIGLVTLVSVPSLFRRKCTKCGAKNSIEARVCKSCGAPFPEDD